MDQSDGGDSDGYVDGGEDSRDLPEGINHCSGTYVTVKALGDDPEEIDHCSGISYYHVNPYKLDIMYSSSGKMLASYYLSLFMVYDILGMVCVCGQAQRSFSVSLPLAVLLLRRWQCCC